MDCHMIGFAFLTQIADNRSHYSIIIPADMDKIASKTVIFDFDGTIADSFGLVPEGLKLFAPKFGITIPKDLNIDDLKELSMRDMMKKYRISIFKILHYWPEITSYMHDRMKAVKPFAGIKLALEKISRSEFRMFVITSNSQKNVQEFLKMNHIEVFEGIYSKRNLFGKAAAIDALIRKKKFDKKLTFYVGDETRDIEAAGKCGIKIIAVTWGYNNEELLIKSNPDFIAKQPEDIVNILENY